MKNFGRIWIVTITTLFVSFFSLFSQTKEGISLGDLQFVKPSINATMASRTLQMKMSSASITPRFYAKIGGVAFIQTASPSFDVESFYLACNYLDNIAYAKINGNIYNIPLEVWQLQPIVEYADDENNVAVTIYGDSDARVKLHKAFIDKLLGLRLLQTDLLLASSYLNITDRGKFPSYDSGEYIMSSKEKEEYQAYQLEDSILYDASYQDISSTASLQTYMKLDSLSESFETYIYTDYNQDITFNLNQIDKTIDFEGKPYYRFASRDKAIVDTLEMYNSILSYMDTFNVRKQTYNKSLANYTFNKDNNKLLYRLQSIARKKDDIKTKAKQSFELLDFYEQSKDTELLKDDLFSFIFATMLINNYVDSLSQCTSETKKVITLCNEINTAINDPNFMECDYMLIHNLSNELLKEKSSDENLQRYCKLLTESNITYDRSLLIYLYRNRIPGIIEAKKTTDYFKNEGSANIYWINPLIYNEATEVCQWSAFFRYVKQNYPQTWKIFKEDVKRLRYDAPDVWTPIDFENMPTDRYNRY